MAPNPPSSPARKKRRKTTTSYAQEEDEQVHAHDQATEADYSNQRMPIAHVRVPRVAPARNVAYSASTTPYEQPVPTQAATPAAEPEPEPSATGASEQGRWKSTATTMHEFQSRLPEILNALLAHETHPAADSSCECDSGRPRRHRCTDCCSGILTCDACIIAAHTHLPWHRVEVWCGTYFSRTSLFDLGAEFSFGHGGLRCPNAPASQSTSLVVVHTNGIHKIRAVYCACAPLVRRATQLLSAKLFPATWDLPETAFTFHVMKHYHLDSLQSRTSGHDYWALLRRLTDNTRPDGVPDRYEELLRASRQWRVLMRLKRSGQAFGIASLLPHQSRSVSVTCPACPEPGLNLPPDWKDRITSQNRHEYTLFLGIDGNYRAVLKQKRHDLHDIPLLDGRGYFVNTEDFDRYVGKVPDDPDDHKSTCANLKSMKSFVERKGLKVAGIAAVVCVRHSCYRPNSMIDLEAGEKFALLDYSLAGALGPEPDPALNRILTCDKGFQYCVNLASRFSTQFPHMVAIAAAICVRVPKMHLQGHMELCRFLFSLNLTLFCGRTDGEGVERPWAHSNDTARITRDQNPGHRKDTYDDSNADWNYNKRIRMAGSLLNKLREAYQHRADAEAGFDEFSALVDTASRNEWEKLSTEPRLVNGEWESVFRVRQDKVPNYRQLVDALARDEEAVGQAAGHRSMEKVLCGTTFLALGLDLEDAQLALRDFVKSLPGQPSRDQQRDLCLRRAQLRDDLSSFQALQQVHMPLLGPTPSTDDYQLHAGEDYGLPEEDPLCMPSAWPSSADRERLGFAHLVDREAALRRAQADRALARMRVSIQTWNSVLTFGHQNVAGQRQGTRLQNRLASHRKDIDKAANAYRRHYDALNSLGLSTEDAQRYRPLTEADLRNLHVKASKPAGLGESQLKPPWFWGTDRDADERSAKDLDSLDALTKEETRVRWFRARANRDRFCEEVDILHAELERTHRMFETMGAYWSMLGESDAPVAAADTLPEGVIAPQSAPQYTAAQLQVIGAGRRAYAQKQAAIYRQWQEQAARSLKAAAHLQQNRTATKRTLDGMAKPAKENKFEWSFY